MTGRMHSTVRIVEQVDQKCWTWRTYIISWPSILGMYSTWMQLERKYCWGIQKDVRVTNLKKCLRRYCELANKKAELLYQSLCSMLGRPSVQKGRIGNGWRVFKILLPHRLEMPICGPNCSIWHALVCQQTLHILSRYGPELVTNACFDLLHIHHTSDHGHYCHVVIRHRIVPRLRFCWRLKILNTFRTEFCVSSEVEHSFLWIGNKLQSLTVQRNLKLFLCTLVLTWTVSPLSILGIWLLKCCILPKNLPVRRDPWREETRGKDINTKTKKHVNRDDVELFNVYHVAKLSHFEAMLYICDDNEAVIKMITIGGRPTMRHVSRTHRVALDWLFDIK